MNVHLKSTLVAQLQSWVNANTDTMNGLGIRTDSLINQNVALLMANAAEAVLDSAHIQYCLTCEEA